MTVGWPDDRARDCGRVDTFEIASDEQLIGCELNYSESNYLGVTWLKMKTKLPVVREEIELSLFSLFDDQNRG